MEANDRIFRLLDRIIHIPMHQYARYFERYTQVGAGRPVNELVPNEILQQFRDEVLQEQGAQQRPELELEREIRIRIHNVHLEIFKRTQLETTRRWVYESEVSFARRTC